MKYGVNILALYWEEMGFKIFFFLEYKRVQEKDVKKKSLQSSLWVCFHSLIFQFISFAYYAIWFMILTMIIFKCKLTLKIPVLASTPSPQCLLIAIYALVI